MKNGIEVMALLVLLVLTGNLTAHELGVGQRFRDCAECPEMVVVPAGSFLTGYKPHYSKVGRKVLIPRNFALGKYEVTVGEFRQFMLATGYRTDAEQNSEKGCWTLEITARNNWDWTAGRSWRNVEYAIEEDQPVVCVSWRDAQTYVSWLQELTGKLYRLPSELEWEYAARAGSEEIYYFGRDEKRLCAYGNVADSTVLPNGKRWYSRVLCNDGSVYAARIGSYKANAFGLHDMYGNVWEWVQDCWNHQHYQGLPRDGSAWEKGDCSRRVVRGGSWYGEPDTFLHSMYRDWDPTGIRYLHLGFRVARALMP